MRRRTPSPPAATPITRPLPPPKGILRLLSEDELAGVVAHELAHVKNRDILISSIAATIAAAIMFAAQMARFAASSAAGDPRTIAKAAPTRSRCSPW